MAQNDDLGIWHSEPISANNSADVVATDKFAKTVLGNRPPDFINVATAGDIDLVCASGYLCDGQYLTAGWHKIPFKRLMNTGTITTACAGWKYTK